MTNNIPQIEKDIEAVKFQQYFKSGKDENNKNIKPQKELGRHLMAKHLIERYKCIAVGKDKRNIFRYVDGIYIDAGNFVKCEVQRLLESYNSIGNLNEILEQIKNLKMVERDEFENVGNNFICLNNGIYNIREDKLLEHDPEYYFFTKIPINYNPETIPTKTIKVLETLLEHEQITIIQEWMGFAMYRQYFVKKALIMTGVKNTGKTTVLNIIMSFIGKNNISGVSLHDLSSNKFALADLYNKHINIYDELSSADINDTGKFKMVTGQSPIMGEFKYGERFPLVNYSKLTFACNKIPAVNDVEDEAYFDRWIIVNFNKELVKADIDPFLMEKLKTEEELSGMLNFAIRGLKRLLEQKDFSYNKTPEEIKVEMLKNSNPMASFVYNCITDAGNNINNEDNFIIMKELYGLYVEYCEENEMGAESGEYFYRNIKKYAPFITKFKKTFSEFEGPDRKWCYGNVISVDNKTNE